MDELRRRVGPVLRGKQLRDSVAALIRNTFGMETGALDDWPDLVDPDTARAVPLVADAVIQVVLLNYKLSGQLTEYIAEIREGG